MFKNESRGYAIDSMENAVLYEFYIAYPRHEVSPLFRRHYTHLSTIRVIFNSLINVLQ